MKFTCTLRLMLCLCAYLLALCAQAAERVQLDGELRNLTLVEPTEHGKAELHFPGPAMLRLQVLPSSR